MDARWGKSQSNDTLVVTILYKKKFVPWLLTIVFGLVVSAQSNNYNQSQGHEFNF